jgi:hypothetical protein
MLRFLCLIFLVFLNAPVRAETNETLIADYMPFLDGHLWPCVPLVTYVETKSNIWIHPSDPKHFPTIREVADKDSDFATVVIQLPDGTIYKTYNYLYAPGLVAVYMGDFNNDGIPDFMAIKEGTGCGLAAEWRTGVFAFSGGGGYHFTRITAMGLGPHSLVLDPKTKSFRLIHTSDRWGETLDGKIHSFWVHRFFKWDGDSFRNDADLPPVWIQYLNRPNHEATKLLTPQLKAKIWAEESESKTRIEW